MYVRRLLRTQAQFAQVMFIEFAMGVGGFVQRERARHVDFKGTGFDESVESLNLLRTRLDIVALDFHAGRRIWRGFYTVRIGYSAVLLHCSEGAVGRLAASRNEGRIQTARRKSAGSGFDVIFATVCYSVCAEPLRQRNAIIARGDGKYSGPDPFGQLNRQMANPASGSEYHQRFTGAN